MKLSVISVVCLLYCAQSAALRDLRPSVYQDSSKPPIKETTFSGCSLLAPSPDATLPLHQAAVAAEVNIKETFAVAIAKALRDIGDGKHILNMAAYEAFTFSSHTLQAINETAIKHVSEEGPAICASVFDDAQVIANDIAAIFVEVLDASSGKISFVQPCDAIDALASITLDAVLSMLSLVCDLKRPRIDLSTELSSSALTAAFLDVIREALNLAVPDTPAAQLFIEKSVNGLKVTATSESMIPVPLPNAAVQGSVDDPLWTSNAVQEA